MSRATEGFSATTALRLDGLPGTGYPSSVTLQSALGRVFGGALRCPVHILVLPRQCAQRGARSRSVRVGPAPERTGTAYADIRRGVGPCSTLRAWLQSSSVPAPPGVDPMCGCIETCVHSRLESKASRSVLRRTRQGSGPGNASSLLQLRSPSVCGTSASSTMATTSC